MTYSVLVLYAALAASLSSASDSEAILQQLAELHKEIKALRREVGELRQAVTAMHRSTVATPTSPPPPPVTVTVRLDNNPLLGNRQAAVGIVEFSDYQCPFCRRFHEQTFARMKTTYIDTGKVQYIFRDFPLNFHQEAKGAAIAANCAGQQGAYWDMHHALFTHQHRLGASLYEELATTLNLDVQAFQTCLQEPAQAQEIEDDLAYGQRLGVRGTPNFFVGLVEDGQLVEARQITGAQPWSVFEQVIEAFLQ